MSAHATAWAWKQRAGKAKLLLLAIADCADERGEARVDIETLAEAIDCHRSTVIRQLEYLETEGLIEREEYTAAGIQLVSKTFLMMGHRQPATESQNATRPQESAVFSAVAKCDPAPKGPVATESQNATHKENPSSLLVVKSLTSINTIGREAPPTYGPAMKDVVGAGLTSLWGEWVALGRLARPTQEAQIVAWADWIRAGRADALRAEAQNIILAGSYAHPFAALRKKLDSPNETQPTPQQQDLSARRAAFQAGQRVRYADGTEATVISVLSRGIATDHPQYPDVPLAHLKTLEVIP